MAHFAKIEDGIVTQIVVVDNEHETYGEQYLNDLGLEGTWVQTSYNANFRKKYAGIEDTYDAVNDWFVPKKPSEDSTWDEATWTWIVPAVEPAP